MVSIRQSMIYQNNAYTKYRQMKPEFLILHSTGDAVPQAVNHVRYYNSAKVSESVHAFIDGNSGEVWQTLPWFIQGGHAGGSINRNSIGVEMCEPADMKYGKGGRLVSFDRDACIPVIERTYRVAVELFAMLCCEYGLSASRIYGHGELKAAGLADTTHVDPMHLWEQLSLPFTMDSFRKEVAEMMINEPIYQKLSDVPEAYKPTIEKLLNMGIIYGNANGLDLTRSMCRVLVYNDRAGLYG